MKATTLLENQHRKVEAIFKKLENAKPNSAAALVTELATDLAGHMVIEEEIFYPAAKRVKNDLVLESYEEHALAAHGLKRLVEALLTTRVFTRRSRRSTSSSSTMSRRTKKICSPRWRNPWRGRNGSARQ
jgi:hypothetical protein